MSAPAVDFMSAAVEREPDDHLAGLQGSKMGGLEADDEFMKSLRPGSVLIRPVRDPILVAHKDARGRHIADPRTGLRFYRKKTGHSDPRGHFSVRDESGEVIFWGNYRTAIPKRGTLLVYVQSLFKGSGRDNEPNPRNHGLGEIPAMYLADLDLIHGSPSGREVIIVDERLYWFEREPHSQAE